MPLTIKPWGNLSRRSMFRAAGAAMLGGCTPSTRTENAGSPWYALLSDPHIAADPHAQLRGETMAANLRSAVSQILHAGSAPESVIINGDLAFERGELADYGTFLDSTAALGREGLPLHLVLGNHDDRENFRQAVVGRLEVPETEVPEKIVSAVPGLGVRFVMLDSQDGVNRTAGHLGASQLRWLAGDLDSHPVTPTILMLHHHLDANARPALRDTVDLVDLIRDRRQVKMVVYGHTHRWTLKRVDGVVWMNLPALGYRFARKEPLGWVALHPHADGAEVQLQCVAGDQSQDGRRIALRWRNS